MKKVELLIVFGFFLAACGGSSSEETEGDTTLEATFSSLSSNIFSTSTCAKSGCHSSASASAGLSLAEGEAYDELVGVASTQAPTLNIVKAGSPGSSYLINKLRGTQTDVGGSGVQMPKGGTLLTEEQISTIEEWITNGAENN